MGCTVHWIDHKTLERKSCALSCTRITGRHTYDVLAREIYKTLTKYKIEENTSHAVTDNAANFGKAFRCDHFSFYEIFYSQILYNLEFALTKILLSLMLSLTMTPIMRT